MSNNLKQNKIMEEEKSIQEMKNELKKREAMKKLVSFALDVQALYETEELYGGEEAYDFIEDFLMAWTDKGTCNWECDALRMAWEKIKKLSDDYFANGGC